VQRLDTHDVHRIVDVVAEIESSSDDQPFPPTTLELLGTLISADAVGFCELDRVERRVLGGVDRDGDQTDGLPGHETFWHFEPSHPLCAYQRSGHCDAVRLSDFLTTTELHRLAIYAEFFHLCNVEHQLEVCLPSPASHTKTFIFDRASGDFSERDRLVLNLLQPHLIRRYARWAAEQRTVARLAEIADQGGDPTVLILGRAGKIEFAQRAVRRLLADYFGEGDRRLAPMRLREWADGPPLRDLVVGGPDAQLVVSVALHNEDGHTVLLLRERSADAPRTHRLTPRERDVLELVGDGKSNAEIGRLLWVQPSTIRKHLENAYAKLNVRNRIEATALLQREAAQSDVGVD
jgi:DNA-binding CsgD family transcriptional regulator